MTLSESYEDLHKCLHTILTKQFRQVGNTKLNAEFALPFNTIVKVTSEQKRDLKTDIQMILHSKIIQLEKDVRESVNFYSKNESFHKLATYKEVLSEIESLL